MRKVNFISFLSNSPGKECAVFELYLGVRCQGGDLIKLKNRESPNKSSLEKETPKFGLASKNVEWIGTRF